MWQNYDSKGKEKTTTHSGVFDNKQPQQRWSNIWIIPRNCNHNQWGRERGTEMTFPEIRGERGYYHGRYRICPDQMEVLWIT